MTTYVKVRQLGRAARKATDRKLVEVIPVAEFGDGTKVLFAITMSSIKDVPNYATHCVEIRHCVYNMPDKTEDIKFSAGRYNFTCMFEARMDVAERYEDFYESACTNEYGLEDLEAIDEDAPWMFF